MAEYIEREALEKWLLTEMASLDLEADRQYVVERLMEAIPAADVRPVRRGTWTDAAIAADNLYDTHGMLYLIRGYACNCCCEFSLARFNFCPNCGADMRGGEQDGRL